MAREEVLGHQADDFPTLADRDPGIERDPALEFGPQLRSGDGTTNNESARRADVDGVEVPQLLGEHRWPEGPVAADIEPSQENHERHACLVLVGLESVVPLCEWRYPCYRTGCSSAAAAGWAPPLLGRELLPRIRLKVAAR